MSYETGTATDQHNLLDKVRTFLVANGWTQNGWADDGTGKRLHVSKGGLYFNFRSAVNERVFPYAYYSSSGYAYVTGIALCGSTGYDGGEAWDEQPGGPIFNYNSCTWGVCAKDISGAVPAYHLFTLGANSVCLVVEYQSGKFQYLVWGELDKSEAGTYTGGQFVAGSRSAAAASYGGLGPTGIFGYQGYPDDTAMLAVRMDIDSITEYWWPGGNYVTRYGNATRLVRANGLSGALEPESASQYGLEAPLIRATPNAFNGLTPLFPIPIIAERASDKWSYIGRVPNTRMLNMTNYSAGDEVTFGSDTWKVFPQHSKTDTYPEAGLAILKVT
jgi:hypothetical protein